MTTITVNLEDLTAALATASKNSLGWVWLRSDDVLASEPTPPSFEEEPPPLTTSEFVLVPSTSYRFKYRDVRYVRFAYLLERGGQYEEGELTAFHDAAFSSSVVSEPEPPVETFTVPTITTTQSIYGGVKEGSLGVLFSFIHDTSTSGEDAQFGLAYKLTQTPVPIQSELDILAVNTVRELTTGASVTFESNVDINGDLDITGRITAPVVVGAVYGE